MFNKNNCKSSLSDILIELPHIKDARGELTFVQPPAYTFKRAFWIYGVPAGAERGQHAHRTCSELLIAVYGSLDVELFDGKDTVVVHLDNPHRGLFIRPLVWCRLYNFTDGFVGVCLASQEYLPEGYINTMDEFLSITNTQTQ